MDRTDHTHITHITDSTLSTQPQTILVTGGAGFIGSWLVRGLLETLPDSRVINLDALTYAGNRANLADVEQNPDLMEAGRYRFVHGDICDPALVDALMAEATMVVNVAAESHVDRSITGPMAFTRTNVLGTHVLLESARCHGITRFLQVSTDEVYGSLALGEDTQFDETSALAPNSPYSATKAAGDMLCRSYFETFGLPVLVTRCGNNYGPYQFPEKLIPFFILRATNNEPLPVYGDGLNIRDWIHVKDHVSGLIAVLLQGTPGQVYNIGANNQQSNMVVTLSILKALGKPDDLIEYVTDRPGHDRRYALDTQKIRHQLGWSHAIEFETGLCETIAWYQKHTAWLEGLKHRPEQHAATTGAGWLSDSMALTATAD
ncbi:MAG: dTDP-glucose 4,6-dehydratase [Cyanobacteria bacterium HKST-UBA04]|nr:dTDP-glucose 4,6-dehydratase [Cyanobacteria bacterium HKST-UBA04]